jgi:site-specific recombinase XerD
MLDVVKARCRAAGLSEDLCNHTFRGTGITVFLHNGGALGAAQDMANHSDPRTTKLYDRRKDLATLSEIERRTAFEKRGRFRVRPLRRSLEEMGSRGSPCAKD